MTSQQECSCGSTDWDFAVVGLTTEIVCAKCGKMPYEKSKEDKILQNILIDEIDKYGINKGKWKKNDI